MHNLINLLEIVTHPKHALYYPVQAALFGGISYLGTALFLSTPPKNAAIVTISAYMINQLTAPLFSRWLEPHREITLVPLAGQVAHLIVSFGSANIMCKIAGCSISLQAIVAQLLFMISTVALIRLGLRRLQEQPPL